VKDPYSSLWVSHSSISDYLTCPRLYYLKNVYKDPKTNRKIQITNPSFSLGSAVHEVVEALSLLPTQTRFASSLNEKFEKIWEKYHAEKGGFFDPETEYRYKSRGQKMVAQISENPGPLANLTIRLDQDLPHYWLSEEDGIILCGKIDWLEYLPPTNGVHIIDFKTNKNEVSPDSLQLPIYLLLATNCQTRPVEKVSYWYLGFSPSPSEQDLPDLDMSREKVLYQSKLIKAARSLGVFKCPKAGCSHCLPYESVLKGDATLVGSNGRQDIYIIPANNSISPQEGEIF